jgi:hypothetical protein
VASGDLPEPVRDPLREELLRHVKCLYKLTR